MRLPISFPVFSPLLRRWPLFGLAALFICLLAAGTLLWSGTAPAGAQDGHQPDPQVVADVWDYAKETNNGHDHVLRWIRVLQTFGEIEDMTAAEAQANADKHLAERWDPVVTELTNLEADDGYEPDAQVVSDVRGYSAETDNGFDHVLRWMRVLHTFGALDDMTAAEAQGYADRGWGRWVPVAAELEKMEAAASEPEPTPEPTAEPTPEPTAEPTPEPTAEPTPEPTAEPTPEPTAEPTPEPTAEPEQDVPGTPSNFAVSATAGDLDLSATWDALEGADTYKLAWRQGEGAFEAANAATVTTNSATVTVSGYGQWEIQLQGCNDAGCGPAVTQTAGIKPGSPANFGVTVEEGELDLSASWDALDGATSYQVAWRQDGGEFEADNAATVTANSATITVSGYGRWIIQLQGCNAAGCGAAVTGQVDVLPAPQHSPLEVSVTANPAEPRVNEATELSAVLSGGTGEGTPSYNWEVGFGDDSWLSLGRKATFSYLTKKAETLSFRVTVSFDNGESATSDPITVEWTEVLREPQVTATTFVSNTGQTLGSGATIFGNTTSNNWRQTQAFTTGDHSDGYTLSEVDARFAGINALTSGIRVSIYSTSSGTPNTSLHVLNNPASFTSDATNTFTAPANTTLDANTTYAIVFEVTDTSGSALLKTTNSDDEDSGAASGWSIADIKHESADGGSWSSNVRSFVIAIKGTEKTASSDPAITIAAGTSPVTEGTAAEFTVTADPAPSADLTVNLTVSEAAGSDFVAAADEGSKTVTITANSTAATLSVPTTADTTDEPDGDVSVTVETGTGYTVGTTGSASVTVNDDDLPANTLVSNVGQTLRTADGEIGVSGSDIWSAANTFTTGARGATLSEVDVRLGENGVGSAATLRVSLYSTTTAGLPDSSLLVFDNPGSVMGGRAVNTFTVPTSAGAAATLAANTTYAIVFETTSSATGPDNRITLAVTVSADEDSGGQSDWSIGDDISNRQGSGSWNQLSTKAPYSVAVRGTLLVDESAPKNLNVEAANNLDLIVRWQAPSSLPANHAVTGYTVEWTPAGGSATTAEVESDHREHYIAGLTEGAAYTARVAAKITDSTDAGNPVQSTAWSVTSPAATIWQEPIQGWLIDGKPNFNSGRIFITSDDNMINSAAFCSFKRIEGSGNNGTGTINCPPRTLVSLDASTGANHVFEVSVTAEAGSNSSTTTFEGQVGGPAASIAGVGLKGTLALASGGNARLVVGWTRISSLAATGTVDAVVVETRRQNPDGSWPSTWTQTVIEGVLADVATGTHTLANQHFGTYQVRVRGRTDGDDGDANTTDVPRLGFTSPTRTVTVDAGNTNAPDSPTAVSQTRSADGTKIAVSWEPPTDAADGAAVYGYKVRHREQGTSAWTESEELYPEPFRRFCSSSGDPETYTCENPRTYTVTGLTTGTDYDVEVLALNANSSLADDATAPALSAVVVNGTTLTLRFDEFLDVNSLPTSGDFVVTVGGSPRSVVSGGVAIYGATVSLTLDSAVALADTVQVRYTKGANPLRDAAGNDVATFTDQFVANITGSVVSNAGQVDADPIQIQNDLGQAFTTGSHPGGYTLSRVEVIRQAGSLSVSFSGSNIHTDSAGVPGDSLGTLTRGSSSEGTVGLWQLAASADGIPLEPNTTYWLVLDIGVSSDSTIFSTSSDAEDAGGASGWSIADGHIERDLLSSNWSPKSDRSDAMRMVIHATPNPTTVLVGNYGQPDGGDASGSSDHAQAFTTGSGRDGYQLTQVDLEMSLSAGSVPPPYTVKIHADSSGSPGTALADGTLAQQGTVGATAAKIRFASDGVELDADTTYWIVFDIGASG